MISRRHHHLRGRVRLRCSKALRSHPLQGPAPRPTATEIEHVKGPERDGTGPFTSVLPIQGGQLCPYRVDLRARDSGNIRNEVCPDPNVRYIQRARVRGALRLILVDSATSVPMTGIRFLVSWPARTDAALRRTAAPNGPGWAGAEQNQQALTDSRGAATFCDVPYGFPVEVSLPGPTGLRAHVMMVELGRTGITGRVVYGRINR